VDHDDCCRVLHRHHDHRQQTADGLRQCAPHGDHAVPGFFDDDRLQPDSRWSGISHTQRLSVRGDRFFNPHRGL
nr:hypothetical protein [Tanacetum cinerariifolium]